MQRTALVTGATAGFGAAICRTLIENGYRVIGTGRRVARLEQLQQELGKNFHFLAFDISDRQATEDAFHSLPANWQSIDLLVNNAGLGLGLESADKASLDDWMQMIDTNIKGLVTITRLVLPQMVERNSGHIINLGSIAGTYPYPGGNVYGGTKAFIKQFSLNLRADLAGTQIRVSNIEPGVVELNFRMFALKVTMPEPKNSMKTWNMSVRKILLILFYGSINNLNMSILIALK